MSIVVIWASPNKDGLTATAKDRVLEGIQAAGGQGEAVQLNLLGLKQCCACQNGWGNCRSQGRCILPDGFQKLYDRMVDAQGVVLVTPVYWHDLAETLKGFLDRLRRCETGHNHYLADKECLLIACAGGSGIGAIQCLNHLEDTLSHMRMKAVDRLPVTRFNREYLLPAIQEAGAAFARHLK